MPKVRRFCRKLEIELVGREETTAPSVHLKKSLEETDFPLDEKVISCLEALSFVIKRTIVDTEPLDVQLT